MPEPLSVFQGRLPAHGGIGACPQTAGQLGANLELARNRGRLQRLQVGVYDAELHAFHSFAHHARHGIRAAATDTDDLEPRAARGFLLELELQPAGIHFK